MWYRGIEVSRELVISSTMASSTHLIKFIIWIGKKERVCSTLPRDARLSYVGLGCDSSLLFVNLHVCYIQRML